MRCSTSSSVSQALASCNSGSWCANSQSRHVEPLAHLARVAADAIDVEPYGLEGTFPGFGTLAYEGRDVYAFEPVPGSRLGERFDMALGGKDGPKIRFTRTGTGPDGSPRMSAAPHEDIAA